MDSIIIMILIFPRSPYLGNTARANSFAAVARPFFFGGGKIRLCRRLSSELGIHKSRRNWEAGIAVWLSPMKLPMKTHDQQL